MKKILVVLLLMSTCVFAKDDDTPKAKSEKTKKEKTCPTYCAGAHWKPECPVHDNWGAHEKCCNNSAIAGEKHNKDDKCCCPKAD